MQDVGLQARVQRSKLAHPHTENTRYRTGAYELFDAQAHRHKM